jgi:hypothetical protein
MLKVFVKAEGWDETEKMLHQFKDILPSGASIAHLNIKTPKDNDWFAQGNALKSNPPNSVIRITFFVIPDSLTKYISPLTILTLEFLSRVATDT